MAYLAKARKEDLKGLAEELDLDVPIQCKVAQLRNLILTSEGYDQEFTEGLLDTIIRDRKEAEERRLAVEAEERRLAIEVEERRFALELEKQTELTLTRLKLEAEQWNSNSEQPRESPKLVDLQRIMQRFDPKEGDINLYLVLFERQAEHANIKREDWVSHLLGLLPYDITQLIAREEATNAYDYGYVKALLLKKFKLSPELFRLKFTQHKKTDDKSWKDFAFELACYFKEWIEGLEIADFKKLKDLIIADQLKRRVPQEIREHFVDEWSTIASPTDLAELLDKYESVRGFRKNNGRQEDASVGFPNRRISHGATFGQKRSTGQNKLHCYGCGAPGVIKSKCPTCTRAKRGSNGERTSDTNLIQASEVTPSEPKGYPDVDLNKFVKKIKLGELTVEALLDTGSTRNILREDVYKKIKPLPVMSKNTSVLTGLGKGLVRTVGSFQHVVDVDGHVCRLDFQVIPTEYVNFEAILGSAFLSHAPCPFHEKAETDWIFHISEKGADDELDLGHVRETDLRREVTELVSSYRPNKTKSTDVSMKIILEDEVPVYQRARRLSFSERQEVNRQIDDWLKDGIVRPSSSNYTSPVVLVKKKDLTTRLCVDYRQLNRKLVKDRFPLPLIEDVLDSLQNSKVFSTLDLKNGFFHVPVEENSCKYTSFIVPDGQYEFLRVPFGLSTSPSVFQRYVYSVFRDLIREGIVVIYMDDLIIPSSNEAEGVVRLKIVLQRAAEYGLEIKVKKCQFLKRSVKFLGYIVEDGTVRPSSEKTLSVQRFPLPINTKQVQSFLGLTGYFRKFIEGYAKIAKPLSDLLRKDTPFVFGDEQRDAYQKLKALLTTSPVLHLFKSGRRTELHTDASTDGFGAILFQEADDGQLHPVHFMSKKTSPAEEKYSSYELEVLAVVEALKKLRVYLKGDHFTIVTDCSAFQKTMNKKDLVTRIARWAMLLEEFDYEIVHRPGQRMQHVDALSRNPVMVINSETVTAKLKVAQAKDDHITTLKSLLQENNQDYLVKNGILYRYINGRELIMVPQGMQAELIKSAHEKGHFSVAKTEEIVKQEFFIPNLRSQTETILTNCIPCILSNRKSGKKEGTLYPIPKEDSPLHTYHVDFIGPLPSTNKQYQHILTVVDAFSKFVWLYPVKSTSTGDVLDKLKLQQKTFGNPVRIITDRGTAFTSNAFKEYCDTEDIQLLQITTGVPRGNGQVERIHRTLIPTLTKLSESEETKWFKYVPQVQRILNSTVSRSTKYTPFQVLTGVKMRNKEDINVKEILDEEMMNDYNGQRSNLRNKAKENILKIQLENKKQHDKKCKNATVYKQGDLVAVQRTQFGTGLKLRPKFFGPYEVTKVNGRDRYEVRKIGNHVGPNQTTAAADHMKPFG